MSLDWKEAYRTGNAAIDLDHQALFNITKVLAVEIECGHQEAVGSTIRGLIAYIERHFKREEALFEEAGYPGRKRHFELHRAIEKTVRDIAARYEAHPESLHSRELLEFLERWLAQHILKEDLEYVPYLDAKKTGIGMGRK